MLSSRYYTADLSPSHLRAISSSLCGFRFQFPLNVVMIIEGAYCFALRFIVGQVSVLSVRLDFWR